MCTSFSILVVINHETLVTEFSENASYKVYHAIHIYISHGDKLLDRPFVRIFFLMKLFGTLEYRIALYLLGHTDYQSTKFPVKKVHRRKNYVEIYFQQRQGEGQILPGWIQHSKSRMKMPASCFWLVL